VDLVVHAECHVQEEDRHICLVFGDIVEHLQYLGFVAASLGFAVVPVHDLSNPCEKWQYIATEEGVTTVPQASGSYRRSP